MEATRILTKEDPGYDKYYERFVPSYGCPIPSKNGYRPQAEPWRPVWEFPRGLGLNIPRKFYNKRKYKILIPIIKQRQKAYLRGVDISFLPTMPQEFGGQCPYLKDAGISQYKSFDPRLGIAICLNCPLDKCFYDKREGRGIRLGTAENCNQSYNRLQQKVTTKVTFISNHKKGVLIGYR